MINGINSFRDLGSADNGRFEIFQRTVITPEKSGPPKVEIERFKYENDTYNPKDYIHRFDLGQNVDLKA